MQVNKNVKKQKLHQAVNGDQKYANKNVIPGFRNVQFETSVNEYPGLTVNPRCSRSSVKRDYR